MAQSGNEIHVKLRKKLNSRSHLLGVAAGSGLTAKYAELGGADFILALSAGRFRQMGVSSLAGYMPYANSNRLVFDYSMKELLPIVDQIPVIFGLCAEDPTIQLADYISAIKSSGFSGINNFPTIGLFDGVFHEALEAEGITYAKEVEAIRLAHEAGLFTIAFVFDETQAEQMMKAGADILCAHLGLTVGGLLGAKKLLSLKAAKEIAGKIFAHCPDQAIRMIYGGPISTPPDLQFMYDRTSIDGYIGGSAFERIPAEQSILTVMQSFKQAADVPYQEMILKLMRSLSGPRDYVEFVIDYIHHHYMEPILLEELAAVLNLSRSYLSTLFKSQTGVSFTDYLINYRLDRAIEILTKKKLPVSAVAEAVGYPDAYQFSKIFKKKKGLSPNNYLKQTKEHKQQTWRH